MTPTIDLRYGVDVLEGLAALPAGSVHCVVTSPPYHALRSYLPAGHPDKDKELGQDKLHDCLAWARGDEPCGACFVCNTRAWLAAVWRVLRPDGCVFLNIGDSFSSQGDRQTERNDNGRSAYGRERGWAEYDITKTKIKSESTLPPKNLMLIPARVALALQADGWIVRNDIIWAKTAPMPESVTDRLTRSHEHVFMLAKQGRYYFDAVAVSEQGTETSHGGTLQKFINGNGRKVEQLQSTQSSTLGGTATAYGGTRNRRDVLTLGPDPYPGAHFATMPRELARICILAGSSAAGCCPKCQAPYIRVTERTAMVINRTHNHPAELRTRSSGTMVEPPTSITTGWRPSCTCHAGDPIPATILDPFSGSGTTAAVAKQCGRSAIGIDLNAAYLPLAEDRIAGVTAPMVPAGYEDPAPVQTNGNGNGQYETQKELFA